MPGNAAENLWSCQRCDKCALLSALALQALYRSYCRHKNHSHCVVNMAWTARIQARSQGRIPRLSLKHEYRFHTTSTEAVTRTAYLAQCSSTSYIQEQQTHPSGILRLIPVFSKSSRGFPHHVPAGLDRQLCNMHHAKPSNSVISSKHAGLYYIVQKLIVHSIETSEVAHSQILLANRWQGGKALLRLATLTPSISALRPSW